MNPFFWREIRLRSNSTIEQKIQFLIAEFLGTAMLMFIGCMACTLHRFDLHIEKSIGFGFSVVMAIQSFGHISGAHINPILSMGAVLIGHIAFVDCIFYLIGQFTGALFGYGLLKVLVSNFYIYGVDSPKSGAPGICSSEVNSNITKMQIIFIEISISFVLMTICCGVWDRRSIIRIDSVSIRFGLVVAGIVISAGPFTGAHMNPARSLAPAILNNYWENQHLFWIGPIIGSILASLLYVIVFKEKKEESDIEANIGQV